MPWNTNTFAPNVMRYIHSPCRHPDLSVRLVVAHSVANKYIIALPSVKERGYNLVRNQILSRTSSILFEDFKCFFDLCGHQLPAFSQKFLIRHVLPTVG